jgi:hypothetical protein
VHQITFLAVSEMFRAVALLERLMEAIEVRLQVLEPIVDFQALGDCLA